jgi:hypothetical protein
MQMTMTTTTARPREPEGWRQGRPVEDPAKTKRCGFVTAKPSEFLVHCRRGRVLPSSGQGATCFKWPWDSVSIVPTSLQRLHFVADQITLERVGVSITGLAVYRVAEPLLAFRVLNFSFPERAQEKLEQTLTEMMIGATRRLVANLAVDECLQKRKAALADELLRELAPVIGGQGRPDDPSDRGWGLVLDTVEIQEVKVLSDAVFAAMQAPYRASLQRRAREAQLDTDAHLAAREAELARQELERRSQQRMQELARAAELAARQAELAQQEVERRSLAQIHQLELALREEEARIADSLRRQQLISAEAQSLVAAHEPRAQAIALQAQLERIEWQAQLERRASEADTQAAIDRRAAEVALAAAQAEQLRAEAQACVLRAQQLPQLAAAVGQKFGEVKITQIGASEQSPFGAVAQAVAAVLELAKQA